MIFFQDAGGPAAVLERQECRLPWDWIIMQMRPQHSD